MKYRIYIELLWDLLLTIIIEGAAIMVVFRVKRFGNKFLMTLGFPAQNTMDASLPSRKRLYKYAYYSLLCNLLTNPAMNLLLAVSLGIFGNGAYYPTLVMAELAVVFVEAIVYNYICSFGIKKAALLSAFLNTLSFAAGILMAY